ncbi:hypothetical protein F511_17015 [Dorcoceras hygrometricum]|uniref:Uncharacterized protein n=1 Tax=Dorcoceras hygrometricum TaxID=472368 RepID=A0A2Z7BWV6_9LAMI|nr:hypothetical protein F511_17015 [Dorcoceras hygrometricum]
MVSVQYGLFNPYIPIRSTTIGKSRVAKDPIAMHTSWRSNSDIASVTRKRHLTVGGGRYRQSSPRLETGFLRQPALEGLTRSARTDSPRQDWPEIIFRRAAASDDGGAT